MSVLTMPDGQRCQAKDKWGVLGGIESRAVVGSVLLEHGCDHPASVRWGEGMLAAVHGMYSWWCSCCALDAQIEHAEKAVARLAEMKQQRLAACEEKA